MPVSKPPLRPEDHSDWLGLSWGHGEASDLNGDTGGPGCGPWQPLGRGGEARGSESPGGEGGKSRGSGVGVQEKVHPNPSKPRSGQKAAQSPEVKVPLCRVRPHQTLEARLPHLSDGGNSHTNLTGC